MNITISPTTLAAAGRCMRMVYYESVLRIPRRESIAKAMGIGYHKQILDVDQTARLRGDIYPLPIEELIEGWSKDVREAIETVPDDDDTLARMPSRLGAYNVLQKAAANAFRAYAENRKFFEQARAVEVPFEVEFGMGTLRGFIDMDFSDSMFADLKSVDGTKKRPKTKTALQTYHDRQFAAYAAAKAKMSGLDSQDIACVSLVASDKKAELTVVGATRGAEAHAETEELAYVVQRAIEADVYPPVDKSGAAGFWCSKQWCNAWSATLSDGKPGCPFGQRARSKAVTVPDMPEGE